MKLKNLVAASLLALGAHTASALTITTGSVNMGLFNDGGLGSNGVGISLIGGPGDAITPGCLCEGWGASASGVQKNTYGGSSQFASSSITTSSLPAGVLAESTVTTGVGLNVKHTYSSVAGGKLFKVHVAMTNTTAGALADVRYARTLDWDVPPGHFSDDFTTIYGGTPTGPGGNVLHTSSNPFDAPNPLATRTQNANTNIVNAPGDLGAFFILGFGALASGATQEFDTFIGADFTTAGLLSAMGSVGVEAYSYTFDNNGGTTYGWGFANVGLPPALVPEPGSMALVGLGLFALAGLRRRKLAAMV